jgi:hypothetical protein
LLTPNRRAASTRPTHPAGASLPASLRVNID